MEKFIVKLNQTETVKMLALELPEQARNIAIVNNDDYQSACGLLLKAKRIDKQIGEIFDPIIRKSNATYKEAINQRNKVREPLLVAESILKPKISDYLSEEKSATKVEGISSREIWKYEVTDINLVPRDYLKIDDVKVGQVVRSLKSVSVCAIPGIRVYSEKIIAVGTNEL